MADTGTHTPELRFVEANGISMACFEWRAQLRGSTPSLLLVHATGFHARVWDRVIAHLPAWHIIAVEQRAHGRSTQTEITQWATLGRDLAGFVAALDLSRLFAVGHSMGAHTLVQAAAIEAGRFEQLMLIDPVIASPQAYHDAPMTYPGGLHPAARRRSRFASVDEMIERFTSRMPYSLFDQQALRDYCTHGVLPAADGEGVELACSPITEASVYMTGRSNASIYASIRALRIPVTVVRARQRGPDSDPFDYSFSPTWPEVAGEFRKGQDLYLSEHSHFLPMQDPQLVAQLVIERVTQHASVAQDRPIR